MSTIRKITTGLPAKSPRGLCNALLLCTLALLAGGCGTQQHKSSSWSKSAKVRQEADGTKSNDPWFCQAGLTRNAWDCVQDAALAARPRPERMPKPPPQQNSRVEAPSNTVHSTDNSGSAHTHGVPTPSPEPIDPEPPSSAPNEGPKKLAKHVALSYKPSKPTAIIDLPEDFFAVQLMALSSKAALEKYARENKLTGLSAARIWNGDKILFVLLLGIYENRINAELAIDSLHGALGKLDPWIRSVGSLQAAMLAAESVTRSDAY